MRYNVSILMPRFTIRLFKYGINKCFPPILLAGLVDSLCFLRLSKFTKLGVATWISISEMNSRLTHHEFAERSRSVNERSKLCGNINFQYLRCPNAPRIFNSLNSLGPCVFRPCTSYIVDYLIRTFLINPRNKVLSGSICQWFLYKET